MLPELSSASACGAPLKYVARSSDLPSGESCATNPDGCGGRVAVGASGVTGKSIESVVPAITIEPSPAIASDVPASALRPPKYVSHCVSPVAPSSFATYASVLQMPVTGGGAEQPSSTG